MTAASYVPVRPRAVAEMVLGFGPRKACSTSERVLIVEDDHDTRLALEIRLIANNYDVAAAVDGARAAYLLRELLPDLVVLDLGLPGLDGFAFLDLARSMPPAERPKILIHSAWEREEHERRALALGASLYLQKPANDLDLLVAIRNLLDQR
ncbi:MAG: response regulator [Planctomycetota bacterium]